MDSVNSYLVIVYLQSNLSEYSRIHLEKLTSELFTHQNITGLISIHWGERRGKEQDLSCDKTGNYCKLINNGHDAMRAALSVPDHASTLKEEKEAPLKAFLHAWLDRMVKYRPSHQIGSLAVTSLPVKKSDRPLWMWHTDGRLVMFKAVQYFTMLVFLNRYVE